MIQFDEVVLDSWNATVIVLTPYDPRIIVESQLVVIFEVAELLVGHLQLAPTYQVDSILLIPKR